VLHERRRLEPALLAARTVESMPLIEGTAILRRFDALLYLAGRQILRLAGRRTRDEAPRLVSPLWQ
jgi:hypothetical protein